MHCNPPLTARDRHDRAAALWAAVPEPVRASLRAMYDTCERERIARSHALAQRRSYADSCRGQRAA